MDSNNPGRKRKNNSPLEKIETNKTRKKKDNVGNNSNPSSGRNPMSLEQQIEKFLKKNSECTVNVKNIPLQQYTPTGTSRSSNPEEWFQPKNTRKPAEKRNNKTRGNEINDQNSFEPLNNVPENNPAEIPEIPGSQTKTAKPPPIHVSGIEFKNLIKLLNDNDIQKGTFTVSQVNNLKHSIYPKTLDTFNRIKIIILKSNEDKINKSTTLGNEGEGNTVKDIDIIEFFTYTPKEMKPQNIIIKGIRGGYDEDEILSEINSLNI